MRHILTWAISYKCYHSQKALTTISYPDEQTNTKPLLDMGVDNVTESGAICKITNIQETLELAKTIDTTIDKPIAPAELYNTKMSTIERDRQTQIETETPVETEGRIDIQLIDDQNQNDNENKSAEDAESVEDVEDSENAEDPDLSSSASDEEEIFESKFEKKARKIISRIFSFLD